LGIQNKPSQLALMASVGARVPETLISDDPRAVLEFARGRRVVYKPTTGGALAVELDEAMKADLELIVAAPVIFQEWVSGDDVRVTLVDGRIVSSVAVVTPEGTLDYRSDPDYARGKTAYREVALPEEIARAVKDAARVLGLSLAGIDVRIDRDRPQRYAVLEANPSPTYLDIELKMGHMISDALIDALER
jgi:glutathione synthase/RimK-type ligase-like ATP-grasp enzyme